MTKTLKAPFPYMGGKSSVAGQVWNRLGNCPNYIEPFAGSLAVLLSRPHAPGIETVNDADGLLANFWRALRHDPERVAYFADNLVHECDLHARHVWLVNRRETLTRQLEGDPDFYDAQAAGYWVYGICLWIGSGWCAGNGRWQVDEDGELHPIGGGVKRNLPNLRNAGMGINRKLPHLGDAGKGIYRTRPNLRSAGQGIYRKLPHETVATPDNYPLPANESLYAYFYALADRLKDVRVCCGDWSRVCGNASTVTNGLTAVFLDPPYALAERTTDCYAIDRPDIAIEVREWAIANGDNPLLRICLCGYTEEHADAMPTGWVAVHWKTQGGYSHQGKPSTRGKVNRGRECLWFSPHCLRTGLFDREEGEE